MEANFSLRSMGSNVRLDDRDKEIDFIGFGLCVSLCPVRGKS